MTGVLERRTLPPRAASATALLVAAVAGYLIPTAPVLSVLLAASAVGVLLLLHPWPTFLVAVGVLPFGRSLLGADGAVQLSATDLLATVAFGALVLGLALGRTELEWSGFYRRVLRWGVPYAAVIVVGIAASPAVDSVVNAIQRFQLVAVPLGLGYLLMRDPRRRDLAVRVYLVAAVVLALGWILVAGPFGANDVFGVNKNPSGQFLANGLLLVIGYPPARRLAAATVPLLSVGLLFTQSRGSLIGAVAGLLLLAALSKGVERRRLVGITLIAAVGVTLAFQALPESARERTTRVSSDNDFSIGTREAYREDALAVVRSSPWLGVGIGNYSAGDQDDLTFTTDPHNVLLLVTAENGLPGLAAFGVLVLGTGTMVFRRRRYSPLAVAALAVQTSGLVHGVLDVYWVRGTPTLGWLLVGAAMAPLARAQHEPTESVPVPLQAKERA